MPRGSHVILLGGPETEKERQQPWLDYTPFNELDRWFPLTYAQFHRYTTDNLDRKTYTIEELPGTWRPNTAELQDMWRRYNANIRVDMQKLRPILDSVLPVGSSYQT